MRDGEHGRYLHVVRKPDDEPQEVTPLSSPSPSDAEASGGDGSAVAAEPARHDAQSVIGTAVMHAAMSWVACCMEQQGVRVEVAQIAPGLFDARVYLADSESDAVGDIMLRVRLDLSSGPVLRTQVEPVHP